MQRGRKKAVDAEGGVGPVAISGFLRRGAAEWVREAGKAEPNVARETRPRYEEEREDHAGFAIVYQ